MESYVTRRPATRRLASSISVAVFGCLFCSGFSSLLYQVIWTRFAYAGFGVIAPVLSLTIATFMLGIGMGTLLAGRMAETTRWPLIYLYAGAELIIAAGAFIAPPLLQAGAAALQNAGPSDSAPYLALSALGIIGALLPWCIAMGTTIPLMLGVLRAGDAGGAQKFSFLYIANVAGAVCGAAGSALVLVELVGLHGTCAIGALSNVAAAGLAVTLPRSAPAPRATASLSPAPPVPAWIWSALFITSFSSVGMELCWARGFTMALRTSIYAFAAILATYLLATLVGSTFGRLAAQRGRPVTFEKLGIWLVPFALLPAFAADPRMGYDGLILLASITPLCGLLGAITPELIDRAAGGNPRLAARLYAVNIAGGILGPVLAGYILLPYCSIRISLILLALPLGLAAAPAAAPRRAIAGTACAMLAATLLCTHSYDEAAIYPAPVAVHRDYAGTALAFGTGFNRQLVVNGIRITNFTVVTKEMADLPMVYASHPTAALDICFGMGTTFHTLAIWPAQVTAVDLSSAVLASFGFFHGDAAAVASAPGHRLVADDGRRYLARSRQTFNVITIDPPPPIEAAGSSLLYSEPFYALAKRHLAAGGVLAQWVPDEHSATVGAVALALHAEFPYILVFRGENDSGLHFLASMTPLPVLDTASFIARMPVAARIDLMAWEPGTSLNDFVSALLRRQIPLAAVLPPVESGIVPITDDRPFNEYFLLRRYGLIGTGP